jgi:1,4-alpha-glucan branching enzyme
MYINKQTREFGAWPLNDTGASTVRFSLFFPNASQFVAPAPPGHYGDPQIASIWVIGSFQEQLSQQPWTKVPANAMRASPHGSGKGTIWQWTTAAPLPEGFYEYQFLVRFSDGSERQVADPCARWGGEQPSRSGVVVGISPIDAPLRPLKNGRKPYRDLVVYELNIDDFSAEIPGPLPPVEKVRQQVDYLTARLGVNAVLFMPWTAWASDDYNWGYAPVGYFAVEHRYTHSYEGGEDTTQRSRLKRLISELHDLGVHVIMDGVFNHAGPDTGTGTGFAYRHFYLDENDCPYIGQFGGQFVGLLDLNYYNFCTQEFIQDVCFYWMDEFGIDGIRYDNTVNMVADPADNRTRADNKTRGIQDLTSAVAQHALTLDAVNGQQFSQTLEHIDMSAASFTDRTAATSYWRDSLYQDCFQGLWQGNLSGRIMTSLDAKAYLSSPDKVATTYLSNHDHSCVAWRAGGCDNSGSMEWFKTQPYAVALLLAPGTPLIPNGQEFASDHWIPENDEGSSRRVVGRPLHWGYLSDKIGKQLFPLYQRLIALRLGHPSLRSDQIYPAAWPEWQGQLNPQGYGIDVGRQLMIFHRWGTAPGGGLERFIVVLNFSGQDQWVDIPFPCDGLWSDVLAAPPQTAQVSGCWLRGWKIPSNYGCVFLLSN